MPVSLRIAKVRVCKIKDGVTSKISRTLKAKYCYSFRKVVVFTNSGTEANELALMIARLYTRSHDIISLTNGYHGNASSTMAATAQRNHKYNVVQALLSGLAYCLSSCSMILVNKYVLSSYDFNAGISLMLYQNFVSVLIVSSLSILGVISTEPLTWRLIKVWLLVNFIFVGSSVSYVLRTQHKCREMSV
ncbi:GDP-mannose transporter GONST1 isoform X2 [Tanacetum coccineum]